MTRQLDIPVLVLGGGVGGVAASLALAEAGVKCVVTEPTRWLGGQLTSQAVPPDENKWIEGVDGVQSATRSYLKFRSLVRVHYKEHASLTDAARNHPRLNPGGGWVSRLCFAPVVGEQVIMDMLGPHIRAGLIQPLLNHEPVAAHVNQDRVTDVTLRNLISGDELEVHADLILDATETGDLYPLADIEHHIGAEHRNDFSELHGREDEADPMDQQAITWCFAMEHRTGESHVIDKPANYDTWRSYRPKLDPPWPGELFSWVISNHDYTPRTLALAPWPDNPEAGTLELWRYRRIVNHALYQDPTTAPPDVSLFNCVQMDYFQKPLLGVDEQARQTALREAREQSLCFFYWMQTEAPRHDDKKPGYPGLKLRGDELGTDDGFAIAPYIREPRRLIARTILTEAHVGQAQRLAMGHKRLADESVVPGEPFKDSVGIGHYPIDLHPSTAGRNELYIPACPFRIPLGALIPNRTENVLAAGKALGVTHIANGSTRLHPVEWNIGESAGTLAAYCLTEGLTPEQVHTSNDLTRDLQQRLSGRGVPLSWPWEDA